MEFYIGDEVLEVDDIDRTMCIVGAQILGAGQIVSENCISEYDKSYSLGLALKNIPKAVEKDYKMVQKMIFDALKEQKVFSASPEMIEKKCLEKCIFFAREIEKIYSRYIDVTNQRKQAQNSLELQKLSRGKFVGGGFGIGGAIKGMMIAGALNSATGAINSIFDSMDKSSVNKKYSKQIDLIYKDPSVKTSLADAISKDLLSMYDIFCEYMEQKYGEDQIIYCSEDLIDVKAIIDNIEVGNVHDEDLGDAYFELMETLPSVVAVCYSEIALYCEVDSQEIIRLADYFGFEHVREYFEGLRKAITTFNQDVIEDILDGNVYFESLQKVLDEPVEKIAMYCIEYAKHRNLSKSYTGQLFDFSDDFYAGLSNKLYMMYRLDEEEYPVLFIDTTFSKSAKEGILLTNRRVYSSWEDKVFDIDDIYEVTTDKWSIYIDGEKITKSFNKEDQRDMMNFLIQLIKSNTQQRKNVGTVKYIEQPQKMIETSRMSKNQLCKNIENLFFEGIKKDLTDYGRRVMVNDFGNSALKSANNMIKHYVNIDMESEFPIFWYDATLMCSGKEGFLVTNRKLYYSNKYGKGSVPLNQIASFGTKSISLLPNFVVNGDIILPVKYFGYDCVEVFAYNFIRLKNYIMEHSS